METDENKEDNLLEGTGSETAPADVKDEKLAPSKQGLGKKVQGLVSHFNIYLLLFILILVIVVGVTLVSYRRNKKEATTATIATQELTAEELSKLKGSDASVGDPKQTLTIESNALFNGKVLVRDSLDVAGSIKVGGPLSLVGLTVSGTSSFE